jgi:hypothetical protein
MKNGEDICIKGAISERLFYNLTAYYVNVLRLAIPSLKKINIIPESLDSGASFPCAGGVVTGFSAGIDSFCTIYDHLISDPPPHFKLTHFVFNNVGSHGQKDYAAARKLFNSRYELVKGFPQDKGIDFLKIDSNLNELLKLGFQKTHIPRNVSALLMLQKLFAKYYYTSAYRYQDCYVGETNALAYTDPVAVHLLSTETLECISTGCQYSRVEKTARTAEIAEARHLLNVCITETHDGKNCSTCWKCCRTLVTLEMLGLLEEFDEIFDLDRWRRVRSKYLLYMLSMKGDKLVNEIKEHAKHTHYSFGALLMMVTSLPFSDTFLQLPYKRAAGRH